MIAINHYELKRMYTVRARSEKRSAACHAIGRRPHRHIKTINNNVIN
ncbi:Hypothetical protein ETEE_4034 [Edwardsiella anguillarum ET080813]|uniref:Uncharacterized protein n=1 Tax=Edwardsiella anguillarum ET080813 TaxID=667120 RepID=A0A076LUU3_9GAMM|nr:Hypothetical protein ETEE_4034 [Edwardsiella anguillarum ET080813]